MENQFYILLLSVCLPLITASLQCGHPSALWALFISGAYVLWKKKRPFLSGLVLSLFIMKPNYYVLAGAIFLLALEFKVAAGMLAGAAFTVFITGVWDGFTLWKEWFPILFTYGDFVSGDSMFERQHSTKTFFQLIYNHGQAGRTLGFIGAGLGCLALILPGWYKFRVKGKFNPDRFWFAVPVAMILASPHLFDYDLVMLLLPFILIVRKFILAGISKSRQVFGIAVAVGLLGLLNYLSFYTHFQVTVPVFWLMLWDSLFPITFLEKGLINMLQKQAKGLNS